MALQKLPALPADYPLFDWADWPDSRAALVQGGPTRNFQKACWNAIIDALTGGITDAGLELYRAEEGLTPNHLKMLTGVYGTMSSALFNTTRATIDDVIPFRWAWEVDRSFRGYIGRNYFVYRHGEFGMEADTVYPEYFLELVRRVNLLLELLRGTALTGDVEMEHHSVSLVSPGLRAGRSVLIGGEIPLGTALDLDVQAGRASPIELTSELFRSAISVEPAALKAASVSAWVNNPLPIRVSGEVRRPVSTDPRDVLVRSKAYADLVIYRMLELAAEYAASSDARAEARRGWSVPGEAYVPSGSRTAALMWQLPFLTAAGSLVMDSKAIAELRKGASQPVTASSISGSKAVAELGTVLPTNTASSADLSTRITLEGQSALAADCKTLVPTRSALEAEARAGKAQRGSGRQLSASGVEISLVKGQIRPGWAETISGSRAQASLDHVNAAVVDAPQRSNLKVVCTIGSAWDAPIWTDDGLWIRQARTIKMKPDGSMDLSGSGDPIAAVHSGDTIILAALDTAWLPPVWQDGGLYIRQARQVEVCEDGGLDLTGAGDQLGIAHRSRTGVSCALDTAWYAPVMVAGGLYIRQAQTVVPRENNELEVQ